MIENRESDPQQSRDHDPVAQNPSHKERIDEKMERQLSPENEIHLTRSEDRVETYSYASQLPAQSLAPNQMDSSHVQQQETESTELQASEINPGDSLLTKMSDEEFQKAKEKQIQEDEQDYQRAKQELQQTQKDESQPSGSAADQNEDHYQGMGQ